MIGGRLLPLVASVAMLIGVCVATLGMRHAERRRWRWLDQRAAERIAYFSLPNSPTKRRG